MPQLLEVETSTAASGRARAPSASRKTFGERIRTDPLSTITTISIDVLSAAIAVALAWWWVIESKSPHPSLWWIVLYIPVVVLVMGARSLYRRSLNRRFLDEFYGILSSAAIASMLLLCGLVVSGSPTAPEPRSRNCGYVPASSSRSAAWFV